MRRALSTVAVLAVLVMLGAGCSSSKHSSSPSASSAPGTAAPATSGVAVTVSPVTVVPNPDSVLSFELRFTTSAPAVATLHVDGPGGGFQAAPESNALAKHDVPVVGLRAKSQYTAWVTVPSAGAETTSQKVTLRTGALPANFPPMTVKSNPTRMAPGVTMFTTTGTLPTPKPGTKPLLGSLIAVDATGNVVWYHQAASPIGDARMIANGHILYEYGDMGAQEIDILGHVVREWAGRLERTEFKTDSYGRTTAGPHAIPVDVDSMHHEVNMLPDGNIVTLSTELRTVSGFTKPMCSEPASQFTGSYQLITDVVVIFEPDTGRVLERIPLADLLHPQTNSGDGSICGPFGAPVNAVPNSLYLSHGNVKDWTHANAVVLDTKRNALLVSLRHLDTVMALRYKADANGPAGALLWRFGPRAGDFKLAAGGQWQYHQHAPEVQDDGSILLFDNGNERANTKQPYTRAVRYTVNDTGPRDQWTVTQTWEYRSNLDGTPLFAFFVGDADRLTNGNVLVDNGGILPPLNGVNSQIVEVVPAATGAGGDVVFDLRVTGPPSFIYRAERLPSLYGANIPPVS